MDGLHHIAPKVYKTLRPLTVAYLDVDPKKVEEGTRVFVVKVITRVLSRMRGLGLLKHSSTVSPIKERGSFAQLER